MQDFVIARQEEEMSGLKVQIGGLQQQLAVAADRAVDLTLKSSGQCLLPSMQHQCVSQPTARCHHSGVLQKAETCFKVACCCGQFSSSASLLHYTIT